MAVVGGTGNRVSGILATAGQLDVWLHVAMVLLTAASVIRYLTGHGLSDRGPLILAGATFLLIVYAAPVLWSPARSEKLAYSWCALLMIGWAMLVTLAPSFSWVAVPLSFVALRYLPFTWARVAIAAMLIAVVVAWSTMQERVDPTVVAGPFAVAALAVIAYRSLERESTTRRDLLHELQDAQADLAEAQHNAGVLAERARLSREIHDSVAQGLSSINLLLQAADQRWATGDTAARDYVRQASMTARDGLDEVRRVVHDLAPPELATDDSGMALSAALTRACDQISPDSGVSTEVHIHGDPKRIHADTATALIRTAQGALANVVEHSGATRATVSLTYQPDSVRLDIRDNGCGFERRKITKAATAANGRGRGLDGIESRARLFGGHLTVESSPGEGTAVALSIPLDDPL